MKMRLTKELFVIPEKDSYILYAPLKGEILRVNGGVVKLLTEINQQGSSPEQSDLLRELREKGVLEDESKEKADKKESLSHDYRPTSLTLMPTFDCNLRCVYCYAQAGEGFVGDMPFEVAKAAMDFSLKNAVEQDTNKTVLNLHGGGEPFFPRTFGLVQRSVDYFREECEKKGLKGEITAATNGVINPKRLEWIVNNLNELDVSFDGPKDIQDSQRPAKDGSGTFERVMDTVNYLKASKINYNLRATVTKRGVKRMPEIIEFFHSVDTSLKTFHLEPLFECGRCKTTKEKSPEPEEFLKYALEARKKASDLGIKAYYSASSLRRASNFFCGAAGRNFLVTPQGMVTTCLEITRPEDQGSEVFMIGNYDSLENKFRFSKDKIQKLREREITSIPHCSDCFVKYSCSGDCLAKTYLSSGDIMDTSKNPRCETNRGLLLDEINSKLSSAG